MPLRSFITRFENDRGGAIAIVMALFLTVAMTLCAFAVDMGSLYLERRTVQGAADLAAVAAAADIDNAEAAARATLAANGFGDLQQLDVVRGRYTADASKPVASRFEAGVRPFNAVRLRAVMGGNLYFAKSFVSEPDISVTAIGTTDARAAFSVGSRLLSLNGGLVNALLGALLGGNVNLSVMDYNALADAHVSIDGLLSALATDIGLTAGTYTDLLDSHATVGNILDATVAVANSTGQTQAAAVAAKLLNQVNASLQVPLKALVDLGSLGQVELGSPNAAIGAEVGVMSLISAMAQVANGEHQVAVDLGVAVPGLLSLKLDLAIGEPPQGSGWVAVGQPGAKVYTAQTRLRLIAEVGGTGLLAGVRVRLPVYIDIASAEGTLSDLTCNLANPNNSTAVIAAKPAVVRAWIGDVTPSSLSSFGTSVPVSNATIVQVPLINITASAYTEMSNISPTNLSFSQSDVDGRVVKTAESRDLLTSLVSSLLANLDLNINLIGLPIGISALKTLLAALLTPVAAALDPIVSGLLHAIGVHLGEVDVQVHGIRCGSAVLSG